MKLTFKDYNLTWSFQENKIYVLTVENAHSFLNIVQDFDWQCHGEEGRIILSEENNILSMANQVEMIWSPLLVDINAKKILNKLYQEMKKVSNEDCYEEFHKVQQVMGEYLNLVSVKLPYDVAYDLEADALAIFKLCNVQLEVEEVDVHQRLVEYVKVLSMLCRPKLLVLVNVKSYLTDEQLRELYKAAFYCKINMLLIESIQRERLEDEIHYLLDYSDCLIELQ